MNLKGVVSVGSKFHAKYTAEALKKEEMLHLFLVGKKISSSYIKKDEIIINMLPAGIGYLIRNLPSLGSKLPYNIISDTLFDLLSIISIRSDKINFFIGFNNYSLFQMKKLKKNNVKIVLEQRIAHVNTEIKIYNKELGYTPKNLSSYMIKRKLKEYDIADYILVPSKFVYDSMVENNISKDKLFLIPYGYNSDVFLKNEKNTEEDKKEEKVLKLLFVGQIGYRKGVKYLLEAVSSIRSKDLKVELTLVGNVDSDFVAVLKKFEGHFRYVNFIEQEKLVHLYNDSDVFVFPSLCEGSALVTYEALACGLPLITTFNTGSVIVHRKEGILIEPSNSEAIENAILYFLEHPEELKRMANNSLETAKKYTWDSYGVRLTESIKYIFEQ